MVVSSRSRSICICTHASKLGGSTGAGVFCRKLDPELHFKLNGDCLFQAEIFAILKTIEAIARGAFPDSESYVIFVDSQAALRATASVWWKSRLIRECKELLGTFRPDRICLCWVPGHSRIVGNDKADALARFAFWGRFNCWSWPPNLPPLQSHQWMGQLKEQRRWGNGSRYVSRCLWPAKDSARTGWLLSLDKASLRIIIGFITGH